jgi:hypothetical protein
VVNQPTTFSQPRWLSSPGSQTARTVCVPCPAAQGWRPLRRPLSTPKTQIIKSLFSGRLLSVRILFCPFPGRFPSSWSPAHIPFAGSGVNRTSASQTEPPWRRPPLLDEPLAALSWYSQPPQLDTPLVFEYCIQIWIARTRPTQARGNSMQQYVIIKEESHLSSASGFLLVSFRQSPLLVRPRKKRCCHAPGFQGPAFLIIHYMSIVLPLT